MKSLRERFDEKWIPVPESGCWLWIGADRCRGYGAIQRGGKGGGMLMAHRAAYELYRGPIPTDAIVCHKCDITSCVNPDHLFLGTHFDNHLDCIRKGRAVNNQGELHSKAKLTEAQVRQIKTLYQTHGYVNYNSLAEQFDVTRSTIEHIIAGRRWTHIT